MAKNKEFDELEEYEDYEFDYDDGDGDMFVDEGVDNTLEVVEPDGDEIYDEYEVKSKINLFPILSILSIWFMRVGVLLAIGLLIMFFVTGKIGSAFMFIIGLLVSFSVGYIFMFFLDQVIFKNN